MLDFDVDKNASWIPRNSNDQLKLGMQLITFAYSSYNSSLENEVGLLNEKISNLTIKLRESADRIAEADLTIQELKSKNEKLTTENEQAVSAIRKLKIENKRLQGLTNSIKSTLDANNSIEMNNIENKKATEPDPPFSMKPKYNGR